MTLPTRDTIATYGGPFVDYQPVLNPQTDMSSGAQTGTGGNALLADVGMLGQSAVRAWALFTPAGTGVPVLGNQQAMWGANSTAPAVARTGVGLYTVTWPVSIVDQLLNQQTLNLLAGICLCTSQSAVWHAQVSVSGATASIAIFNSSNALADPTGVSFLVTVY